MFTCGGRCFRPDADILTIAEIGSAHAGSFDRARALIDAAADAAAAAVKFQLIYAHEILHPLTGAVRLPSGAVSLYQRFEELEVPLSFYAQCFNHARSRGMLVGISPFGPRSATEALALKPDFLKVASPELNYPTLISTLAAAELPLILSSGVCLLKEIEGALAQCRQYTKQGSSHALLHCITAYPAPETEYNLALLPALATIFNINVGVSDHSVDPLLVPLLARAHGACIVEKHICLSRTDAGLDDSIALDPADFRTMTAALNSCARRSPSQIISFLHERGYSPHVVRAVIGSGEKVLAPSERAHYQKSNRSLHYLHAYPRGTVLQKENLVIVRSEANLSAGEAPEHANLFVGAVLQRSVHAGDGARFGDIIQKGTCL